MGREQPGREVTSTHQQWALGSWEMHTTRSAPRLAPFLASTYVGWKEETVRPLARREVATLRVPLIINLGAPYHVAMGSAGVSQAWSSFVAGVSDIPAVVRAAAQSCALQVDLTPLGARALLGRPLDALTNQVVALEDVLGHDATLLVERLHATGSWSERFSLVDEFLLARLARADACDRRVAHAWSRLAETRGLARIDDVAREVGWSRKHLGARFRDHVGLSTKAAARVLRFESLLQHARARGQRTWSELAATCGYFDQAHLNRDFAEFAETSPTAYLRDLVPGDAGLLADVERTDLDAR